MEGHFLPLHLFPPWQCICTYFSSTRHPASSLTRQVSSLSLSTNSKEICFPNPFEQLLFSETECSVSLTQLYTFTYYKLKIAISQGVFSDTPEGLTVVLSLSLSLSLSLFLCISFLFLQPRTNMGSINTVKKLKEPETDIKLQCAMGQLVMEEMGLASKRPRSECTLEEKPLSLHSSLQK